MTGETHTDYQRMLVAQVEQHGWFCSTKFDPEQKRPGFSTTVGFTRTLGCPEFFISGLSMKLGHQILWNIFGQIRSGNVPRANEPWGDILDGYDVICRSVHESHLGLDFFRDARWYRSEVERTGAPLEMIQVFWPSGETRAFPWDEACEPEVVAAQFRLDLPGTD